MPKERCGKCKEDVEVTQEKSKISRLVHIVCTKCGKVLDTFLPPRWD